MSALLRNQLRYKGGRILLEGATTAHTVSSQRAVHARADLAYTILGSVIAVND